MLNAGNQTTRRARCSAAVGDMGHRLVEGDFRETGITGWRQREKTPADRIDRLAAEGRMVPNLRLPPSLPVPTRPLAVSAVKDRTTVAAVARAGTPAATGHADHAVAALDHVALSVRECVDAVEIRARVGAGRSDQRAAAEGLSEGVLGGTAKIDRLGLGRRLRFGLGMDRGWCRGCGGCCGGSCRRGLGGRL